MMCAEVAVDELAQTTVVVDSASARAPRDEELELRDAECVLDVDGEQAEPNGVLGRRAQAMPLGPRRGVTRAVLVRNAPDFADAARIEMRRERKRRHCSIVSPASK